MGAPSCPLSSSVTPAPVSATVVVDNPGLCASYMLMKRLRNHTELVDVFSHDPYKHNNKNNMRRA